MTPAAEKALRAISYHDLFDFPLTAEELRPAAGLATADETLAVLAEAGRLGLVSTANGLYALRGREALFDIRRRRYLIAEDKYKRALRFFRFARYVPFLRAVFICNTLGRSNAREESDIDLFLVVRPRRLWIARLLLAGLAAALGLRPTPTDGRDKLCFSFFVSEDALNLRPLAIENDVYLARWLEELCPIYDEDGYAAKIAAANRWAGPVRAASASHRRSLPKAGALKRAIERLVDVFGDVLERSAKGLQLRLLPEDLKRQAAVGTGVVLSDAVLKFHDHDRRAEIRDAYFSRVRQRSEVSGQESAYV